MSYPAAQTSTPFQGLNWLLLRAFALPAARSSRTGATESPWLLMPCAANQQLRGHDSILSRRYSCLIHHHHPPGAGGRHQQLRRLAAPPYIYRFVYTALNTHARAHTPQELEGVTNSSADSLRRYLAFTLAAREQEQPPAFLWHLNRPKGARRAPRTSSLCALHGAALLRAATATAPYRYIVPNTKARLPLIPGCFVPLCLLQTSQWRS